MNVEVISIITSACILLCYGLAFFLSFQRTYKVSKRLINGDNSDQALTNSIIKQSQAYYQQVEKSTAQKGKKDAVPYTFSEYMNKKRKKGKSKNIFVTIIYVIIWVVLIALVALGIVYRVNNKPLYFGKNAYLVVETGSMSKMHDKNRERLENANLGDDKFRIPSMTMIKIEKIGDGGVDPTHLHVNDIVAYRGESEDPNDSTQSKGPIIIHRIVKIQEAATSDGQVKLYYQFKGDANSAQSKWEQSGLPDYTYTDRSSDKYGQYLPHDGGDGTKAGLSADYLIGRYYSYIVEDCLYNDTDGKQINVNPGWNNRPLGFVLSYIKSDLGILCLASAFLVILLYYIFDDAIIREQGKREQEIIKLIDSGRDVKYKWYDVKYRDNKKYLALTDGLPLENK